MRGQTAGVAHLIDLDDSDALDPATVGGKAAGLAALRRDGERVPDGVVVPPVLEAAHAAAAVVTRFGDRPLAVRSSATAEDLASASFAGQYRTLLSVCGQAAVTDAIEAVRSSSADPAARGYDGEDVTMAVLVMPMVDADVAGVAFSTDPVTGDEHIVIEAVRGLADHLVEGTATPERWTVARSGEVVRINGPDQVLTAAHVSAVAEAVKRVADARGRPQDVEWAIADGDLHLLQARPITALPVRPEIDEPPPREIWLRADENYARPVRPLEFATWAPIFERTATKVMAEVGAPVETMRYRRIGGWMYMRVIPPMDAGKDDMATPPAWMFGLFLRLVPTFRRRAKRAAEVWRSDLGRRVAEDWEQTGRAAMRARTRQLRDVDLTMLTDQALAGHFHEVLAHVQDASDAHLRVPVLATMLPMGWLGVLSERLLGWPPERVATLVQGATEVTGPGEDLAMLAGLIAGDADARHHLETGTLHRQDDAVGRAYREFLDNHGHQLLAMDLAHPTWAEDPSPVNAMLRATIDRGPGTRYDAAKAATDAAAKARAILRDRPDDLARWEQALAVARQGAGYGDDTEIDVLQALALVRYVAVEAGRRLHARGALDRSDDVFFLDDHELVEALNGAAVTVDVERRHGEYRWALAHPGPRRYGPATPAWPDMRHAPFGARDFLEAMVWILDQIGPEPPDDAPGDHLAGIAASPGRVTGPVKIIRDQSEFARIEPGDVLVCPCTVAAWSVVFPLVAGVVTEVGGPLSHPGILSREYGIPAVVSVPEATSILSDGQTVTVDGATGRVEVHQ